MLHEVHILINAKVNICFVTTYIDRYFLDEYKPLAIPAGIFFAT